MKQIIIFGKTQEVANNKLIQILNNIRYGDVKDVKLTRNECSFSTVDGIYISLVASHDNTGHRCDYAYVDKNIRIEVFSNMINESLAHNSIGYEFY